MNMQWVSHSINACSAMLNLAAENLARLNFGSIAERRCFYRPRWERTSQLHVFDFQHRRASMLCAEHRRPPRMGDLPSLGYAVFHSPQYQKVTTCTTAISRQTIQHAFRPIWRIKFNVCASFIATLSVARTYNVTYVDAQLLELVVCCGCPQVCHPWWTL
jgi:hypothetical protein